MKTFLRIAVGLIALVVIVLGVKQMSRGVHEMAGTGSPPPQELGETYTSVQNGYSFRIPKGWQTKARPQPGMTMISAPQDSGLSSNMVTTVQPSDGSLRDYVELNKEELRKSVPDAKVLSDNAFVTDARVTAQKVKLQNKINDIDLAQTMYFFDGPNRRKVIVTCTAPQKYGAQIESLCDDCMKTFAFAAR
ncbi:hypothetical protein BH20VER3_BH20VER3_13720 [soil metagenome]